MSLSTSLGIHESQPKVIIDTNVLVSAIGFGGKPAEILLLVVQEKIKAVISPILLAELEEALAKVLILSNEDIQFTIDEVREEFHLVQPRISIKASRDEDDNRVLEAAVGGDCEFIITGDKDLLDLKSYRDILILTPQQFLEILK